jgi:hypothetical protein
MAGIRIKRGGAKAAAQATKRPPSPQVSAPRDDDYWLEPQLEATKLLDERISEARSWLLNLWETGPSFQQVRIDLDSGLLPRELWLAILFWEALEDSAAEDLESFRFLFTDDRRGLPLPSALLHFERGAEEHQRFVVVFVEQVGEDPTEMGYGNSEAFFREVRWREVALRWLLHEMTPEPQRIRAKLRETLPRRRSGRPW